MTVCFPPLIKTDMRFSRIRLSEFLSRRGKPTRQPGFTTPGLFWALVASEEAVTTSFVALPCCGTSGVPSLLRVFSEPEVRRGINATTNASDFCHGPNGLLVLGSWAAG